MGAPSGQNQSAYPTAGQVMNRARSFVNDAYNKGQGRILTNTAPFTTEFLNAALEELQDRLENSQAQVILIEDNIILTPIPPLPQPDPAVQISIGYNGLSTPLGNVKLPALPSNTKTILLLEEREVGSGLPFKEMRPATEGLVSCFQGPGFGVWEYRGDAIWLAGSTITEELRMRSIISQIPIQASDAPNLNNVQISILASINALASIVAWHYADARGAIGADKMGAKKEYYMKQIRRRYSRQSQGTQYIRPGYGDSGDRRGVRLPW